MNNWKKISLAMLGVAGLGITGVGAVLLSSRRHRPLQWLRSRMNEAPDRFSEWNESVQQELARLQTSINEIAESLQPRATR